MKENKAPNPSGLHHAQKSAHLLAYRDVRRLLAHGAPVCAEHCRAHSHAWQQIGRLPYFYCPACGSYRELARARKRLYWLSFIEAGRLKRRVFVRHENKPDLFLSYLAVRALRFKRASLVGYQPSAEARKLISRKTRLPYLKISDRARYGFQGKAGQQQERSGGCQTRRNLKV